MVARDFAPQGYARQLKKDLEMVRTYAEGLSAPRAHARQALGLYRQLVARAPIDSTLPQCSSFTKNDASPNPDNDNPSETHHEPSLRPHHRRRHAGVRLHRAAAQAQIKLRYAHVGVANAPQTPMPTKSPSWSRNAPGTGRDPGVRQLAAGWCGRDGRWHQVRRDRDGTPRFRILARSSRHRGVQHALCLSRAPHACEAVDRAHPPHCKLRSTSSSSPPAACASSAACSGRASPHLEGKGADAEKDLAGKKYRGVPVKLWSTMLTGMGAVATPVGCRTRHRARHRLWWWARRTRCPTSSTSNSTRCRST